MKKINLYFSFNNLLKIVFTTIILSTFFVSAVSASSITPSSGTTIYYGEGSEVVPFQYVPSNPNYWLYYRETDVNRFNIGATVTYSNILNLWLPESPIDGSGDIPLAGTKTICIIDFSLISDPETDSPTSISDCLTNPAFVTSYTYTIAENAPPGGTPSPSPTPSPTPRPAEFHVSGNISDNSGGAIVGASIDIINPNTNAVVSSYTSGDLGYYSFYLNGGTYNIRVTPPQDSSFGSTYAPNQLISSDSIMNFILVPTGSVLLSGHVYDSLGNPLPGQHAYLRSTTGEIVASSTTDATGLYSMQVTPASYQFGVGGTNNNPYDSNLNMPQQYGVQTSLFAILQSEIVDIKLPLNQVNIHVQDQVQNPISGVVITTTGSSTPIYGSISQFLPSAKLSNDFSGGPITNEIGDVKIWLFNGDYKFTLTPPEGSNFTQTVWPITTITGDNSIIMTLLQPVVLSGHVYDSLGNPLTGQRTYLRSTSGVIVASSTTDSTGLYSMQVAPASYQFGVSGTNYNLTQNIPHSYSAQTSLFTLILSKEINIQLPANEVKLSVASQEGDPISGTELTTIGSSSAAYGSISPDLPLAQLSNKIGDTSAPGVITDSNGFSTVWLFDGTYNFTANPSIGSIYLQTVATDITIQGNTTIAITLNQSVTLSGHVYDSLGNPLSEQRAYLRSTTGVIVAESTTDYSGLYSMQVAPASYQFGVGGTNNNPYDPNLNVPQQYSAQTSLFSLTQNQNSDIELPFIKINLHVQNQMGNPISEVMVTTIGSYSYAQGSISSNLPEAHLTNSYSPVGALTKEDGEIQMWLFPGTYKFTIQPPDGSIYDHFILNGMNITTNETEIVSLQYNHEGPLTIANLSPILDSFGNYTNPTTVSFTANATSPYTVADTFYTLDGNSQQTYSAPFEVTGDGVHTITYWSKDNVGVYESPNSKTFTIFTNVAPEVNSLSSATINEGDIYSADGSFSDPTSTSWTASIDYGDGSGVQPLSLTDLRFGLNHQYLNDGTYEVTVRITDNQGAEGLSTSTVIVNNLAPTAGIITAPSDPVLIGADVNVSSNFSDLGVLDTHTATWAWGDGTNSTGVIIETDGSGTVSGVHNYTLPGVYTVTLTVTDSDGASGFSVYEYIVIYDPNGGFVTGSGIFYSPEGAYTNDMTMSGIARFGFTSKYLPGMNEPTGHTRFVLKVADFTFESTSYDWLVVAGAKAQYKGTGTVNGSGTYGFMLTVHDSAVNGGEDTFRIKIWDKTTSFIVYDNQLGGNDDLVPTTSLQGGSIIIHQ